MSQIKDFQEVVMSSRSQCILMIFRLENGRGVPAHSESIVVGISDGRASWVITPLKVAALERVYCLG